MKKVRFWKTFAAFVVLIAVIVAWDLSAVLRGRIMAHFDLYRGHYQLLGYGLPPTSRPEFVRLLHDRYGIEFHAAAGCIVSRGLIDYVDGYDEVVEAAAKRKFGHDVFKECSEDAEAEWKQRNLSRGGQ